ncbi:MAG: PAS domain S-box protein [Acidobacteria bacterium]|nr:PAS domain S-box protein [Acidobacteriota bacterium]
MQGGVPVDDVIRAMSSPGVAASLFERLFESAPDAIIVVDDRGRIIRVNRQTELLFGYSREESLGMPVEGLLPERFRDNHVHHRRSFTGAPRNRPMGVGLELYARRKNGSEFPVDILLSPQEANGSMLTLAVVRDVTERRMAEMRSREVFRTQTLIKEIHHRVKNTLQVISSMLYLPSREAHDPQTVRILEESRSRVRSIALVHERLYQSKDLEKIDFAEYVRDLTTELMRTYGAGPDEVTLTTRIDGVFLGIETAIACGLIINELVTNSLKHAFPGGRKGEVSIQVTQLPDHTYELTVSDNGIGVDPDRTKHAPTSLGLRLVGDLTLQLEGNMEVLTDHGTTTRITFAELQYRDRT